MVAQMVKNLLAVLEAWVQWLGQEDPLEKGGHGNPHQYSCLENSMNRGAWWTTVHGVTNSWTLLSDQHYGATVLLRDTRVVLSNLKLLVVSEREILSLNYQVGFKKVLLLKGFWK